MTVTEMNLLFLHSDNPRDEIISPSGEFCIYAYKHKQLTELLKTFALKEYLTRRFVGSKTR